MNKIQLVIVITKAVPLDPNFGTINKEDIIQIINDTSQAITCSLGYPIEAKN